MREHPWLRDYYRILSKPTYEPKTMKPVKDKSACPTQGGPIVGRSDRGVKE